MLESPSNPTAIFHRKGGEGWGPKGGDPNPEEVGVRRVRGGNLEWGLRTIGTPKGGGPKFRAFFFRLQSEISLFLLSLGVFSWNSGGV